MLFRGGFRDAASFSGRPHYGNVRWEEERLRMVEAGYGRAALGWTGRDRAHFHGPGQ